jgi:hypothetical protein
MTYTAEVRFTLADFHIDFKADSNFISANLPAKKVQSPLSSRGAFPGFFLLDFTVSSRNSYCGKPGGR